MAKKKSSVPAKITVDVPLSTTLSARWMDFLTLDQAIEELSNIKQNNATKTLVWKLHGVQYDPDEKEFVLYERRLETDAEYEKRLEEQRANDARQEQHEKDLFMRLSKKFGKP